MELPDGVVYRVRVSRASAARLPQILRRPPRCVSRKPRRYRFVWDP